MAKLRVPKTVFISKYGKKRIYHLPGTGACRILLWYVCGYRPSYRPRRTTLARAKRRGYVLCKNCQRVLHAQRKGGRHETI